MKKKKSLQNAHTPNVQKGMGDYYGSGIRAKIGTMRDNYFTSPVSTGSKKEKQKLPITLA